MDNIKIIVASDSIGETAELVARAGVSQFNLNNVSMNSFDIHISNHSKMLMKSFKLLKIRMQSLFIH